MSDAPYPLDFLFTEITNVHFGSGEWFGVSASFSDFFQCDIHQIATFTIIGGAPAVPFVGSLPHTVSKNDLKLTFTPNLKKLTGFAVKRLFVDVGSGMFDLGTQAATAFINLSALPSIPFQVNLTRTHNSIANSDMTCFTVQKGKFVAGLNLANGQTFPLGSAKRAGGAVLDPTSLTVTVNPKTLVVS